MTKAIKLQTEM